MLILASCGSWAAAAETGSISSDALTPERLPPSVVLGEASPSAATPAPVSAIPQSVFGPGQVQSVEGLTALVPDLAVFQSGNERVPRFSIRGLRENNFMAGEPVASVYIDDVPYDSVFSRGVPLMDVDSAQLWRGPAPTLFGANRPGGVLNIHTRAPDAFWRGYGTVSYGNYNAVGAETGVSGPLLTNSLFAGIDGLFSQRDGYVYNTVTDNHPDTREALAGRASLRWVPASAWDIRLSLSGYRFHDGMLPGSLLGQDLFTVSRNVEGYDHMSSDTEALRISYSGQKVAFLSVTARTFWRESVLQDGDLSPANFLTTDITRPGTAWSQEVRLESSEPETFWHWKAGAFFSDTRLNSDSAQEYNFGSATLVQQTLGTETADNYAVFGQSTFELGLFELTAGLRLDYNTRETTANNEDQLAALQGGPLQTSSHGDREFHSLEPVVALTYKATPQTRFWAKVVRGYQPGGFRLAISPTLPEFNEADSWHYELGGRWASPDDRFRLSSSVFYDDFYHYQLLRPTGFGSFTMVNADRAHSLGLEIETAYRPVSQVQFSLGAGVLQAKFDRFIDPDTGDRLDGRTINFVPQYTVDARATWTPLPGWFLTLGAQCIGSFWLDEANLHDQAPYSLLEARAGYQAAHWGVAVFGRNLLDEHYIANAIHFRQPGAGDLFVVVPGDPRFFGVQVSASF